MNIQLLKQRFEKGKNVSNDDTIIFIEVELDGISNSKTVFISMMQDAEFLGQITNLSYLKDSGTNYFVIPNSMIDTIKAMCFQNGKHTAIIKN